MTDKRMYNCPNCGAPIGYRDICPYCGTRLNWKPSTMEIITTYRPVEHARCEVALDLFEYKHNPDIMRYVGEEMVNRVAREVVKHVKVVEHKDPIRDKIYFRASIGFVDETVGKNLEDIVFQEVR